MVGSPKIHRARELRRKMTPPEVYLWSRLRGREPGRPVFRRQHPFGPFFLDFYCAKARLAVEVDGWMHGTGPDPDYDRRRTAWLLSQGVTVFRYDARDVLADPGEIATCIMNVAIERMGTHWPPAPSVAPHSQARS